MTIRPDPSPILIVQDVQRCWSAAYNASDWSRLAALYGEDAQLLGGKPGLYEGAPRILEYFNALPHGGLVDFQETLAVRWIGPNVIASAMLVNFKRMDTTRPSRLSWTLVRTTSIWRIVSHHASPLPL